jgi:hypothetical protein
MIKNFITLIMIVVANISFALDFDELKSELVLDRNKQMFEGDIISARLQIWPVDNLQKKIEIQEETYIDDVLYLAEVISQKRSENNSDVVLIDMTLVVIGQPLSDKINFKLDGVNFPVAHNLKVEPTEIKRQELILVEQESEGFGLSSALKLLMFSIGLIVMVGSFKLFRMYRNKKRYEHEKAKFKKYWDERFVSAGERKDFEIVYGRKKEWLRLVKLQTPPLVEFFRVMESVQYKKEWTESDNELVQESFEDIRSIFN